MRKLLLLLLGLILISILSYLAFKTKGAKIEQERKKSHLIIEQPKEENSQERIVVTRLTPRKILPKYESPIIKEEENTSNPKTHSIELNESIVEEEPIPSLQKAPANILVEERIPYKDKEDNLSCQIQLTVLLSQEQIEFTSNKSHIKKKSHTLLNKLFPIIKKCGNKKVIIAGHTDSDGNSLYNQQLSLQRANAVKQYFVQHGILSQQLEAIGYGETKPIANNHSREGKQKNRRIEIFIKGNKS